MIFLFASIWLQDNNYSNEYIDRLKAGISQVQGYHRYALANYQKNLVT